MISTFILILSASLSCKTLSYTWVDGQIDKYNKKPFLHVQNQPHNIASYPLARAYPALKQSLYRIPLCDCPTPIRRLNELEKTLDAPQKGVELYLKNDGLSNKTWYGGNKVRKLEFLLAHALYSGKSQIIINYLLIY